MQTDSNRRTALRFPLDMPLEIKSPKGDQAQHAATIRDISASGIYFYAPKDMEAGGKVELYIRLPISGSPGGPDPVLHCIASIIRVENAASGPEGFGVAARIERYEFIRANKDDVAASEAQ